VDGRSLSAIPTIAGLEPATFIQLMTGFRDDTIRVTVMNFVAKAYTDEQIVLLADYFAAR
jgi:cytochrome c553